MENKVVLVTGSSRGIGRACAIEFAKKGYSIVLNYTQSQDKAEMLGKELIEQYGVDVLIQKCDVSNEEEVKNLVECAISKFGRIDILVNNAGICFDEPFEEKSAEHVRKTMDVNFVGTFLVSKYVSKYMLDQKYGKIVNIASTSGLDEFSPFSMDYNASKAAIISLTHDLAIQLQPYVNVNAVAPGWVDTDMNKELPKEFLEEAVEATCKKRMGIPEDISKLVAFLASDDSSYIDGEIIKIDGGKQ